MAKKPERQPLPKSIVSALPAAYEIFKLMVQIEKLAKTELPQQLAAARREGAVQTARSFVVLDRLKKNFDDLEKIVGAVYTAEKDDRVPLSIEGEGMKTVPLSEEGFRVTNSVKLRASIIADAKDDAYKWLRANNMGSLITESVNASSLSSDLGYLINEENKDPPSGLFNIFFAMTASVTAVPTKNK